MLAERAHQQYHRGKATLVVGDVIAVSAIRAADRAGRQPLEPFTELLLTLRGDLGHQNEEIDGYTLVTLFVNDLHRTSWEQMLEREEPPE